MATKRPSSGLLSKVASFFRDSSADQVDAGDSQQAQTDDTKEKEQGFQDLIERKRRDDLVRRREFNQLRKLRKARLGGSIDTGAPVRPSVFQSSSGFGLDERQSTLKKIDVIEAHMVQSWADAKMGRQTPKPAESVARPAPPEPSNDDLDLDFTGMLLQSEPTQAQPLAAAPVEAIELPSLGPIELGLQQAALRFAEGDAGGAEVLLQGLFQDRDLDALDADVLASALFDVYRATGQHDGFDTVAMDYAERFGRSPGEWFSVPDLLGQRTAGVAAASDSTPELHLGWVCPAVLDAQAVAELKSRYADLQAPWRMDWGTLQSVDGAALVVLSDLFAFWTTHPVELHWIGVDSMLQALQTRTPALDRSADPLWWLLRLDALCVLGRSEEFEELALDYCVLYEVSPPSWRDAQCTLMDGAGVSAETAAAAATAAVPLDIAVPRSAQDRRCELVGELVGNATDAMARLRLASDAASDVLVSCALLLRVDRQAVEFLVAWAAGCASRGCHVRFARVPCLVAVLFQQVGMDQHAEIFVRVN